MLIMNCKESVFKWTLHTTLLIPLITLSALQFSTSSRLDFDRLTREYRNILVALEPSLNVSECRNILDNLRNTFTAGSQRLSTATDGRAKFGSVKILVPSNWDMALCSPTDEAAVSDSYDVADIKVSDNHVLSNTMPFTRQYKNCGKQSDDIFLPTKFLLSLEYSDSLKASLFLHEWSKFRYGVYEEHGYYEDKIYPACYSSSGTLRLTACSDIALDNLADTTSADCTNALELNRQKLLLQVNGTSSSSMSFPDIINVQKFCTNTTHNKLANTKHNALCDRQSVSDVVLKHPDFESLVPRNASKRQNNINFRIIQHRTTTNEAGYAFVIEDSAEIRNQSRLLYVKQSIVQMLNFVSSSSQILLWTFSGKVSNGPEHYDYATNPAKELFVAKIPNLTSLPFTSKLSSEMAKQAEANNDLEFVMGTITNTLNTKLANYKWEIFLVTSSPSSAFENARNIIHANSHSLTVLTYDVDPAWIQLYSTPAVRNIITLPRCDSSGNECQGKAYSLFLDAFMDADRSKNTPQYYQKIVETEVSKGGPTTFVIPPPAIPQVSASNFHILGPKFLATDVISFRSPIGSMCTAVSISKYDFVVRMDSLIPGCGLQAGTWTVDLTNVAGSSSTHLIQVIVSSSDTTTSLRVKGSLGITRESMISPSSQITPAFVRVTTIKDQPVIHADVQMTISSPTNPQWKSSQLVLFDNGLDPDVIKDDGVYSAYIQSYSPDASPHIAQITVETLSTKTLAVISLTSESTAALLSIVGSSKCCGSFVPVGNTSAVGTSRHTSLLPGFHTAEGFNSSTLPPSKIGQVQISNDDGIVATLNFIAPGSSLTTGTVDFYEACCSFMNPVTGTEESSCLRIKSPPSDCIPVQSGFNQTCRLSREGIYQDFLSQVPFTQPITIPVNCGIRGVNSNSIAGGMSSNLLEIIVSLPLLTVCEPKALKCNSLSDDCLPIAVFWGLIGCICGLVLIILALLVYYCCTSAKRKKAPQEVLMGRENPNNRSETPRLPDKDSPLYKVYVNKAFIQESDGQMRMVATDGELLSSEFEGPPSSSRPTISDPIPSVRRRSVSVSDINRERGLSNPQWGGSSPAVQEDMPVYKQHAPNSPAKPYIQGNLYSDEVPTRLVDRPPVPVPKNRYPRSSSGYANSNNIERDRSSAPVGHVPVASISGAVGDPQVPMYASVNRNGRRPLSNSNQPIGSLLSAGGTSTFMRPKEQESTPVGSGIVPNRFSRPSSGYQSEHNPSLPRSRPASRLDAFPSSDSDTYSDMSRGIPMAPRPPPVPPPFPKGESSDYPRNPKNSTIMRNSTERLNVQPKVVNRSSGNLPPVPPPKYVSPPPPPAPLKNNVSSAYKTNAATPQSDDEYDDDSEHWDDDDFDFNPGVSYA